MRYLASLMSSGETVQLVVRQHWIVVFRSIVANGLAIGVLVLVAGLGAGWGTTPGQALAVVATAATVVPVAMLVRDGARWQARQFVVTTRRVMEVSGVLNKQVSDSNLDKVNDIVLRQSLTGRLLGYGDLQIMTGSEVGVDRLPRIREPLRFQKMLLDNKEDFDALARIGDGAALTPDEIPAAIERLARLRDQNVIDEEEFERKKADLLARL